MRFFKPTEETGKAGEEAERPAVVAAQPVNNGKSDQEVDQVSSVQESLAKVMDAVDGAIGVALVDFDGGLTLGTAGGGDGLDLDIAGAGNLEVVRSMMRVMDQLGLDDQIEDILITLGEQYHLIRPLEKQSSMFLYLAIDRSMGNLGLARHRLRATEGELAL